jgi:DNA-directed RNA polymerase specialized sigma24 family protein
MASRVAVTGRDPRRIVADLDAEWFLLSDESDEVVIWAERYPVLRTCVVLADVLEAVPGDPDEVLGALLGESRSGSALAARTVLQAMLGKVVLMARADPSIGVHGFLVAMWERIRTYPIERRPAHISANLALDARKWARRDGRESLLVTAWPPGDSFADVVDRQRAREHTDHARELAMLTAGDVIKAAVELELIDPAAGDLLHTVYADGLSSTDAARRHLTSPAMVRQRCSQAVRELAQHSAELASIA